MLIRVVGTIVAYAILVPERRTLPIVRARARARGYHKSGQNAIRIFRKLFLVVAIAWGGPLPYSSQRGAGMVPGPLN